MQTKTVVLLTTTFGFVLGGVVYNSAQPRVELTIEHAPREYSRRAGDLSANVCGRYTGVEPLSYRLNDGEWRSLDPQLTVSPRLHRHGFTLEFLADELVVGANTLELLALGAQRHLQFEYDDTPIALPTIVNWCESPLDVQDGSWQTISVDGETWVRPVPGTEGYDRLINVTGAFAEPRRVEVDMVFRGVTHPGRMFGFGVIPLWGGHREDQGKQPRRGWNYGIAWHYSKYGGVGVEFSDKLGGADYDSATSSENSNLEVDTLYHSVVEAAPADDGASWSLRMKWWADGAPEPQHWISLTDHGRRLQQGEYAVALVAHRCQVEFSSVRISQP